MTKTLPGYIKIIKLWPFSEKNENIMQILKLFNKI